MSVEKEMRLWNDVDRREVMEREESESTSRRPKQGVQITDRDLAILGWVTDQYCVRADVLRHLLGVGGPLSESRTRAVVGRWSRAGLVVQRRVFAGRPLFVWPTREGQRLVRPGWRWRPPSVAMMAHHHQVSVVRLVLQRRAPTASWISERVLLRNRPTPDCHVPDGVLTGDGGQLAVEVELTQKSAERLRGIIRELAMDYSSVLYVAGDRTIVHAVEAAARAAGEAERVRIDLVVGYSVPGVA